uniref:Uncharacterized protein n=1 Tax=Physcomitrium patens TaxID=3218 RepID=A0A2K1J9Q6_PHYPA|nr:hypothetical protein PHYPA_021358 [Physcomitrium patens]
MIGKTSSEFASSWCGSLCLSHVGYGKELNPSHENRTAGACEQWLVIVFPSFAGIAFHSICITNCSINDASRPKLIIQTPNTKFFWLR